MVVLLLRYFWLFLIGGLILRALIWRRRGKPYIDQNPELAEGYRWLTSRFVIWNSIPLIVMGLGAILGGVPSILVYMIPILRLLGVKTALIPKPLVFWVIACYVSGWFVATIEAYWFWFLGGAEMLVKHPGLYGWWRSASKLPHAKALKRLWLIRYGLGVFVLVFLRWYMSSFVDPARHSPVQSGEFATVYEISEHFRAELWGAFLYIAIGIVLLITGIIWIRGLKLPKWWARREARYPGMTLVFSVAWLIVSSVAFFTNTRPMYNLRSIYRSGNAEIVEGEVHVLDENRNRRLVKVEGVPFRISGYNMRDPYSVGHGVYLTEGAYVRLYHHEGEILRIDIRGE